MKDAELQRAIERSLEPIYDRLKTQMMAGLESLKDIREGLADER